MTDKAGVGFAEKTGNERAAWDCYGRCIAGLAAAQLGAERSAGRSAFVTERKRLMEKCGASCETDLSAGQLKDLCDSFKRMYYEKIRKAFPQDPHEQLRLVLAAACASWHSDPAERVRQANRATGLLCAAITVQAMVFGNLGDDSCAGRVVSRDPVTGASGPSGGYLVDAQGEDLTAGSRPAKPITELAREATEPLRRAGDQLPDLLSRLEKLCRHPQDVRFAVERGKLWILQSCAARRTPMAGLRGAVEMATGRDALSGKALPKVLKPGEALMTLSSADLERLLHPVFDPEEERKAVPLTTGFPAGLVSRQAVWCSARLRLRRRSGKTRTKKLIWAGRDTGPADLDGLRWTQGFLTSAGGRDLTPQSRRGTGVWRGVDRRNRLFDQFEKPYPVRRRTGAERGRTGSA
jgi:pyruvate,orthophosphate dikinase